ncbi:hypothetical protein [Methanobacterium spitsbergense]|uniref:Uncharacterized protein n=1 Tax=Methanobacterium spitsbergense TaxID=2874285 RepID=A0A8T5UYZ5_9EURY|nr:hypothetical protein [Methanobacterium spitsbergense]MBZ2166390.1 hypothetical protein [Methanobacterium spitsbergense]
MFDYAANAVLYINMEEIISRVDEEDLNDFLGKDPELSIDPNKLGKS